MDGVSGVSGVTEKRVSGRMDDETVGECACVRVNGRSRMGRKKERRQKVREINVQANWLAASLREIYKAETPQVP